MEVIEKSTKKQYSIYLQRNTGEEAIICPICSEDRKKKNVKCLGWNHDKKIGACNHCGSAFYSKNNLVKIEEKKYTIPERNLTELNDKAVSWFEGRGISKATLMRFNLSGNMVYMPQKQKEVYCINFNYELNGGLVNVKYRDAEKNFKLVSGAKLIFYNLDAILESETVTIVEGEMDCLSMYESGIYDCISVPNGASKGNQRLEYLDNCIDYFENKKRIVIATDNDEAGVLLRNELARRLGKERCLIMPYPEGCKDANDILLKHGKEALKEYLAKSYEFPLEGIKTIVDFDDEINDLYVNGFPEGLKIGFNQFDKLLSFSGGQVTGITGIPNSGKSEFCDQILIKLAEHGWKTGIFSAENQPEQYHFVKLAEKYIGKSFRSSNDYFRMTVDELMRAKEFFNENFFFVELLEENLTVDGMISKIKELVLRKGINCFVIDPWNYLEHKQKAGQTETQYIGESLTKFCNTAKSLNIHIIIVAHPVKIQKEKDTGKYKVATLYDIAGSANWFNKLDNGISVYLDREREVVDIYVQKVRFKWVGKVGKSEFKWDYYTGRYTEIEPESFMPI
jgi:twinkle protein